MAKKKKNIKTEKFSPYTFLVIVSVLGGLIMAAIIRLNLYDYLPQANLFGESGLIRDPKVPKTYNECDIFIILFSLTFWIFSSLIVVFIINIFRKNFANNFIRLFGYTTSKNEDGFYRYQFWLSWLIAIPTVGSIIVIFCIGLVHLINYQFNTSFSESWWLLIFWPAWIGIGYFMDRKK